MAQRQPTIRSGSDDSQATTSVDRARIGIALSLSLSALVAFYVFTEYSFFIRILALVGVIAFSALSVYNTNPVIRLAQGTRRVRVEVAHVVWPTQKETLNTSLIISLAVIVIGIYLWLLDWILSDFFNWFIQ